MRGCVPAVILVPAVCLAAAAHADSGGGGLSGAVVAPDGSRVPGAVLTLTREGAVVATAASGEGGLYRVVGLPPGEYEVRAEAPGFLPAAARVLVEAGRAPTLELRLGIPRLKESLTVLGSAPRDSLEAGAIRESGARDVGEALDGRPGVQKLRKGGIANDVVVRGLQSRDLNVLIDGERVYGACPNHMDPPGFHVDFAEVERIEVAKGPFDVRHQGSLGGLVNVVTRRPDPGWALRPGLALGSWGQVSPFVSGSFGGRRLAALGGFSFRRSDPHEGGSGHAFTELANYRSDALDSEAYRARTAWGRLALRPADKHRLEIAYTRQDADHVLYPYLMMDAIHDDTDRLGVGYEATDRAGRVTSVRARLYLARVEHWMTDEYRTSAAGTPRGYSMGTQASTRTLGGRLEAVLGGLSLGAEAYRRDWNTETELAGVRYAPQHSTPDVEVSSVGAWFELTRAVGKVTLEAGGRLDRVRSAADPAKANTDLYYAYNDTRSVSRSDSLPSGKLRASWQATRRLRLSAGAGHTERVAEANERYFALRRSGSDWVGAPDLDPARNSGMDAAAAWEAAGLRLEVTGYWSRVDGYIMVRAAPRLHEVAGVPNAQARSYANVDARLRGGEVDAAWSPAGRLFVSGRLSYVRGTQRPRPELGISSADLAEMPPLSGRIGLRFDDGRRFAAVEAALVAPQRHVDASLGETATPGFGTAILRAGYRRGRVSVTAGVENLLDRAYAEHLSYQRDPFRSGVRVEAPGRSLYFNASFRF